MPKIFLHYVSMGRDVLGWGMAEDGYVLSSYLSSDEEWLRHDLGLTSSQKHPDYKAHYPDGYDLVWLGRVESLEKAPPEFQSAFAKNQALEEVTE